MPQQVVIVKGDPAAKDKLPGLSPHVSVVFMAKVTEEHKSVVLVSGFSDEGVPLDLLFTAKNFANLAAAVTGWMVETGEIPVKVNPGMAFAVPSKGCGFVEFAAEAPLQKWKYTTQHARKMAEELMRFVEAAEGK